MITSIHCNIHEHIFTQSTGMDQIAEQLNDPKHIFWLDVQSPTEQELNAIADTFHLHPLAVEDASHEHQRPKVEEYENFFFLVFHAIYLNPPPEQELDIKELDIFVGKNYLITVHTEPVQDLAEVEQRWKRNNTNMEKGIGMLLYSLLDTIVDNYFPTIDALVDQAENLEDLLFAQKGFVRERQLTLDLLALKKRFLTLRRIITPERDVLNVLTNRDNPFFTDHTTIYFRDVYDHITRLTDTLDLYRDQLSTIMDANLSVVSNELNKVMRTLTAMSIILMFDALIAGIYGMNFTNMPELQWHYGYFAALLFMAVASALLMLYFRRLRWF
ncbi:MAG TPA: magnesium/cobalt transporter CorA [Ktedonobacteraceae bacterium]|jgi:magnesium transporter|nr:magnesium/cobalt transporter CorA [Ktedonobacteraceae bacterium]